MAQSLLQKPFNPTDLSNEWEEAYKRTNPKHLNAIFSDDEEDQPGTFSRWFTSSHQHENIQSSAYVDPVLSSSTYHIHQADNALLTLKHIVKEDEGWKKALKHKSGVVVHMKNGLHKGDKTPIFKGEAIIQGFSPQSIFYVVGMRKLWDEQYEDGNLVENLNDTTSLTYEVMRPTATSKSRDLALVEKIECTQTGSIIFACTSVETLKVPRVNGKSRANIKLLGWVLEPLHSGPIPTTKVTYVIQESMKGWMPGFAKKSLARRPLVIAKVAEYLENKSERIKHHQQQQQQQQPINTNRNGFILPNGGLSRRPSIMNLVASPTPTLHQKSLPNPHRSNFKTPDYSIASDSVHQHSILTTPQPPFPSLKPSTISVQLPQTKKTISFSTPNPVPKDPITPKTTPVPQNKQAEPTSTKTISKTNKNHLYPSHRHPIQKVESIQLLKRLTHSLDHWSLTKEIDDGKTKYYTLSNNIYFSDNDQDISSSSRLNSKKREENHKMPFIRADSTIEGDWTAEQLCSVIHCFGSRKVWDVSFEGGRTIERFSQKDYLVQWFLGSMIPITNIDLAAITTIETDPISGTVYTATSSVSDPQTPPDESGSTIRAFTDLYGWVFKPKFNSNGQTLSVQVSFIHNMDFRHSIPQPTLQLWTEKSLQSIENLNHYLNQYGCPPYIRRVAGKVTEESFEASKNQYQIKIISKHQPSSSYRIKKQHHPNASWCTDIRFHQKMFPHGLDISVQPEQMVRIQVSFNQRSIKIFTTDEKIDGKQVQFTLTPLNEHHDFATYQLNGELFPPPKPVVSIEEEDTFVTSSEASTPRMAAFNSARMIFDGDLSISSTSTTTSTTQTPSIKHILRQENGSTSEPKSVKKISSVTSIKSETRKSLKEDPNSKTHENATAAPITIPNGYLLVPEHQNMNILVITEDLSFNGQQLAVIFIGMVVCYYLGKLSSCSSC